MRPARHALYLTRDRQEVLGGVCTASCNWGARPVAGAPAPPRARLCSACRTAARLPLRCQQALAQTLSEVLVQGAGLRRSLAVQQDSGSAAAPALGLCAGSALARGRCLCRWTLQLARKQHASFGWTSQARPACKWTADAQQDDKMASVTIAPQLSASAVAGCHKAVEGAGRTSTCASWCPTLALGLLKHGGPSGVLKLLHYISAMSKCRQSTLMPLLLLDLGASRQFCSERVHPLLQWARAHCKNSA